MIKRISRKKLDVDKYTKCLSKSVNYRIYAEVWYLDTLVENNWDCYVLNDYEAIMPLPFVKKFGIKFITQPIYCQQLGVFHQKKLSKETFNKFEKKLHRNLVRAYSFNEENTEMFEPEGSQKINYILNLNQNYNAIFQNYALKRKKDLTKSHRNGIHVKEVDDLTEFNILNSKYSYVQDHKLENQSKKISTYFFQIKLLKIFHVYLDEKLLAVQLMLYSKNRLICFAYARDKKIDKYNSSAFVKDFLFNENQSKNLFFDFEGSMIPSIAKFMQGFGAEKKIYTNYTNLGFLTKKN